MPTKARETIFFFFGILSTARASYPARATSLEVNLPDNPMGTTWVHAGPAQQDVHRSAGQRLWVPDWLAARTALGLPTEETFPPGQLLPTWTRRDRQNHCLPSRSAGNGPTGPAHKPQYEDHLLNMGSCL